MPAPTDMAVLDLCMRRLIQGDNFKDIAADASISERTLQRAQRCMLATGKPYSTNKRLGGRPREIDREVLAVCYLISLLS